MSQGIAAYQGRSAIPAPREMVVGPEMVVAERFERATRPRVSGHGSVGSSNTPNRTEVKVSAD